MDGWGSAQLAQVQLNSPRRSGRRCQCHEANCCVVANCCAAPAEDVRCAARAEAAGAPLQLERETVMPLSWNQLFLCRMWGAGAALRCAAEGLRCAARAEAVGAPLHLSPIVLVHEPPTADVCQWLVSCECLMFLVVADVADVAEVGLGTWPGRRLEYSSTRVLECSLLSIPFFFNRYRKKKELLLSII